MRRRGYYKGDGSMETVLLVQEHMQNILALLRAQAWMYQTTHWQTQGTAYYGDHLLFERLYEAVQEEIDVLAEKLVGYMGTAAVDPEPAVQSTHAWVAQWSEVEGLAERSLQSERDLQWALRAAYDEMKAADALTLGLDDWLMATANTHEAHEYLLQQRLSLSRMARRVASEALSAESAFFDNPEKRETREFADSGAISNVSGIEETGSRVPPTPDEIEDQPGADEFSTLNRFVVETEHGVSGVPDGYDEVPKHPDIVASWGKRSFRGY